MIWSATWAGRDQAGAPPGQAGDVRDKGGLDGFGQAHRRQDRGKAPRQPRRACSWGAEEQEMMDTRSACHAVSRTPRGARLARSPHLTRELDQRQGCSHESSAPEALASCTSTMPHQSRVSNPSGSQVSSSASSWRTSVRWPCGCPSRVRRIAARGARDGARGQQAMSRASCT